MQLLYLVKPLGPYLLHLLGHFEIDALHVLHLGEILRNEVVGQSAIVQINIHDVTLEERVSNSYPISLKGWADTLQSRYLKMAHLAFSVAVPHRPLLFYRLIDNKENFLEKCYSMRKVAPNRL